MNYQGAAVLLDVKTRLPYQKRHEITAGLTKLDGIRGAEFSQYVNRMMIVSYNPEIISAQSIRSSIQDYLDTGVPTTRLVNL